jgi:hypothetical protein
MYLLEIKAGPQALRVQREYFDGLLDDVII